MPGPGRAAARRHAPASAARRHHVRGRVRALPVPRAARGARHVHAQVRPRVPHGGPAALRRPPRRLARNASGSVALPDLPPVAPPPRPPPPPPPPPPRPPPPLVGASERTRARMLEESRFNKRGRRRRRTTRRNRRRTRRNRRNRRDIGLVGRVNGGCGGFLCERGRPRTPITGRQPKARRWCARDNFYSTAA